MWVRLLEAGAFRNLTFPQITLSPGINILYGDNAQGKTNCLEAVYFCALGRTLRAEHCRELIPFNATHAQTSAEFCRDGENTGFTIEAKVTQQSNKYMKSLMINRVPINNTRELFGRIPIVSFSPEDLRLIKAGPSERRRFMDIEICQLSPVYYQDLRTYHRTLRQRNHLLKTIQKDKSQADALPIWDEQLTLYGTKIMKTRAAFITKIAQLATEIHQEITQDKETLQLQYKPAIPDINNYQATLLKNHQRDITMGITQAGIHRDDILFQVHGLNARAYASQGQQRTAALSLKLAEIRLMYEKTGTLPILLLDDVFSELDHKRQQFLLHQIKNAQTLLTCTGLDDVASKIPDAGKIIEIKDGKVKR